MTRDERTAKRAVNIEDLRQGARRRVPRVVFDYIDGGADAEITLRANCRAFEDVVLRPRCAVATPACDLRTTVAGIPLAMPFLLAPMLSAAVAYTAFSLEWVTRPYLETAWTLPAPLGAYLSTGGDYRAVLLQLLNLGLGVLVYWPFVRRYDRRLLARETEAAAGADWPLRARISHLASFPPGRRCWR